LKLLVISSAPIVELDGKLHLYAPYEKEMQLWAKHADSIQLCCPIWKQDRKLLISPISFELEKVIELQEFDITSFSNKLRAISLTFVALVKIFKAMKQADHIHLRCPGNMGLVGAMVQILFPKKPKTAKYAGNWDPNAKQPFSYKLQRWILSNTFLTKNMQVLVYGDWENQTKNIKSFFTATYSESEIQNSEFRIQNKLLLQVGSRTTENDLDFAHSNIVDNTSLSLRAKSRTNENQIKFLFVGALSKGKQPIYAVQLVEELHKLGKKVSIDLYGEGMLRDNLEQYIFKNKLESIVSLKGNQSKETVLKAYQTSHFLILPSKSEGWPKVVAEAMFWGCVPLASKVSCVPYILGYGKRGIQLEEQLVTDVSEIIRLLNDEILFQKMASEGQNWSRQFTTDKFEQEIKELLRG
jgi:glycosyltransferase involved in cell wall biosynthesis